MSGGEDDGHNDAGDEGLIIIWLLAIALLAFTGAIEFVSRLLP